MSEAENKVQNFWKEVLIVEQFYCCDRDYLGRTEDSPWTWL